MRWKPRAKHTVQLVCCLSPAGAAVDARDGRCGADIANTSICRSDWLRHYGTSLQNKAFHQGAAAG